MSQQINFTSYVPTALVGVNSPSKTLAAEAVTNLPIPTGALPGNAFFLSESWANQLSASSVNGAPVLKCHAGWYCIIKVDPTATAATIFQGAVGAQLSLASGRNVVTDMGHANTSGFQGINPVVFLNAVTPGNYTIVQIAGDASVLLTAGQNVTAVGVPLASTNAGTVSIAGAISETVLPTIVGVSEQILNVPGALTLTAAAAASGGSTVYTGTITGGGSNAFAGLTFVVAGFTNAGNNGTFVATASNTTTLTLTNSGGVVETHAGTATANAALIRAYVNLPFGGV